MLYRNLAMLLKPEHAVFGLQPHSRENVPIAHTRITDMASHYIERIRSVQGHGPYLLGGMCAGGVIAFEIARQLQEQGESVGLVALFDSADVAAQPRAWHRAGQRFRSFSTTFRHDQAVRFDRRVWSIVTKGARKVKNLISYLAGEQLEKFRDRLRMRLYRFHLDRGWSLPRALERIPVRTVYLFAEQDYRPDGPFKGALVLFRATRGEGPDEPFLERYLDPFLGWGRRATCGVQAYDVPGGHSSMLQEPHVRTLAEFVQRSIDDVLADEPASPRPAARPESMRHPARPVPTIG
jgi:thioesterase domain-containing protein